MAGTVKAGLFDQSRYPLNFTYRRQVDDKFLFVVQTQELIAQLLMIGGHSAAPGVLPLIDSDT
jgi:hypothetical protein